MISTRNSGMERHRIEISSPAPDTAQSFFNFSPTRETLKERLLSADRTSSLLSCHRRKPNKRKGRVARPAILHISLCAGHRLQCFNPLIYGSVMIQVRLPILQGSALEPLSAEASICGDPLFPGVYWWLDELGFVSYTLSQDPGRLENKREG